jgi:8-oxo-dGTP diphosphatase
VATNDLIKAAGGIIERVTDQGIEIVLIHRTRYGSEWCLPKGKLNENESWKEAALREVHEETGFECIITNPVGPISYLVDDIPKVVLFWKMIPKGDPTFKPNKEVNKLEWLTIADALRRLQHTEEIELIRRVYGRNQKVDQIGILKRFKIAFGSLFQSRRRKRLDSDIVVYRQELHRRSMSDNLTNEAILAINEAFNLLQLAERALYAGDIGKGWKCFLGAKRMEIFAIDPKDDWPAKATVLREEAIKLRSWRKTAVEGILGTNRNPKEVKNAATLFEAMLIRDEHYNNEAYKASLKRDYNFSLFFILTLVIISVFLMIKTGITNFDILGEQNPWKVIGSVAIFGLLGGVVSAIIREMNVNAPSRIPELTTSIRITLLRIFVGSAFAVVVYLFIKSQLIDVFNPNIQNHIKIIHPYTIYAISFVAGFSERLVLRAVSVVVGKES